jgi:hypothetical protein
MARKSGEKPRRAGGAAPPPQARAASGVASGEGGGLRPWHLLLLATLLAVATGLFVTRGTSTINVVAVAVAIATVALAAAAVTRTLSPLVSPEIGEQTEMVGGRTRAAFEREKMLVLRSIKEAEFDRAMGKISDADFHEVATRLRSRAAGLIRQLEGDASGYRALIERELATRVGAAPVRVASGPQSPSAATAEAVTPPAQCSRCQTANDADARFCKSCGARIEGVA